MKNIRDILWSAVDVNIHGAANTQLKPQTSYLVRNQVDDKVQEQPWKYISNQMWYNIYDGLKFNGR